MVQGAQHHIETHGADLGHVLTHDLVAALWHPGHFLARLARAEPQTDKDDTQLLGNLLALVQMRVRLAAGLMQVLQRRAGKFELATRLQGNMLTVLGEADDIFALVHGLPAEPLQFSQNRADAVGSFIGQRLAGRGVVTELFVFRADQPVFLGLAA